MGGIQLTGISTGIDTSAIVQQLMAVESRRLNSYNVELAEQEEVRDALNSLQTNLETLQSAVGALSDASKLRDYETTSSDEDVLTAEASDKAFEGNHTVVVDQLANSERWVHSSGMEYPEDYVGAGTFIYAYNNEESVITTTEDTTLEDLVGLINNDAGNPGVTASLLRYSDAYHLVLSGNDAGSDYQISINNSNTEVWQSESSFTNGNNDAALDTLLTNLDQFSGTLAGGESITISGTLHDGTAVNETFAITENSKLSHLIGEINDAFADTATARLVNGDIVLTDHTSGVSQMSLSLAYNGAGGTTFDVPTISQSTEGGSTSASLAGFAQADFLETQSAQDSRIKVDGYPTGADEWISRSSNTIDDAISGVTLHLHDTGTVQVGLTRDIESLEEKLGKMINAYNSVVTFIQKNTGYNEETETAGLLMTNSTVRDIKNNLRMPLIERTDGFLIDIDAFLMPGQIGLELDRNGVLELDTSVFDEAVAEDYMAVLALIGANKTGNSDSNTIEFYGASGNYTSGGTYDVQVTVSGGAITSAQIKSEDDSTYRNMTIDGNIISGDGTFTDDGNAVYPENGLQLSVDLSQDGAFTATVRVKQGFTGAMDDVLDRILKATNGALTLNQESSDDRIRRLKDDIESEEDRLTRREARLIAKYAQLESTLTLLQRQMNALGLAME
ncbi:MAG: flagellar filament capping protein FliD [Sedimentisphaerales bacterium]|nr:flagellar filament capping protein FliD [Sedimentisphaerales bacterium]